MMARGRLGKPFRTPRRAAETGPTKDQDFPLPQPIGEGLRPIPSKGWAEMIRKVYEADPMLCPRCGGAMKIISSLISPGPRVAGSFPHF